MEANLLWWWMEVGLPGVGWRWALPGVALLVANEPQPEVDLHTATYNLGHHTSDQSPTRAPSAYSFGVLLSGPVIS